MKLRIVSRMFTAGAAASLLFWAYVGRFTVQNPDAFAWWVAPVGIIVTLCFLPMLGLQAGRHIARIERVSPSEYNVSTYTIFGGVRTATVHYAQIDTTHPSNQTTNDRPRSPMGFLRIGKRTGLFQLENKGTVHNAQEMLQLLPTAKIPTNSATSNIPANQPIPLPLKRAVNISLPPRYGPKPNTIRAGKK